MISIQEQEKSGCKALDELTIYCIAACGGEGEGGRSHRTERFNSTENCILYRFTPTAATAKGFDSKYYLFSAYLLYVIMTKGFKSVHVFILWFLHLSYSR